MEAKEYLHIIANEIHRTIVATVDDEGLPVTAAIDMMDSDENSLYFLTAKGCKLSVNAFLSLLRCCTQIILMSFYTVPVAPCSLPFQLKNRPEGRLKSYPRNFINHTTFQYHLTRYSLRYHIFPAIF